MKPAPWHARLRTAGVTGRSVWRTAGIVLAAMMVFLASIWLAETLAWPGDARAPPSIDLYMGLEADPEAPATMTPVRIPFDPEPGYAQNDPERHGGGRFVHTFTVDDPESADLSLFLGWTRRIIKAEVNGNPVAMQQGLGGWSYLGSFVPASYRLENRYLEAGENTITIHVAGRGRKVMPAFVIAPTAEAAMAHFWGRFLNVDLTIAATGVMLFVMILCLAVRWPDADRPLIHALVLVLAAWVIRDLSALGLTGQLPNPWRLVSGYVIPYALIFAFAVFIAAWCRAPRRLYHIYAGAFILTSGLVVVAGLFDPYTAFRAGHGMEVWIVLGLSAIMTGQLVWHLLTRADAGRLEPVLFLVCIATFVIDAVDEKWPIFVPFTEDLPLIYYAIPRSGLLLALGMCASIAAQQTRARTIAVSMNDILTSRLEIQQRQLERTWTRRRQLERERATLEERQRIMRDMHDGIGAQLVSMLMQVRGGKVNHQEVERALSDALAELRLIVDSLDTAGETLGIALGAFRERMAPKLTAAGLDLQWSIDEAAGARTLGVDRVLHVFRILQEACSNAIQHANARSLSISLETRSEDSLVLRVRDDGHGFDTSVTCGKGLSNMAARAASIGSTVSVTAGEDGQGTSVTLDIPLPPDTACTDDR